MADFKVSTTIKFDDAGGGWETQLTDFLTPFNTRDIVFWDNTRFLSRQIGPVPKKDEDAYIQLYFMSISDAKVNVEPERYCCWNALLSAKILFELPLGAIHSGQRQRNLKLIPPPVWQGLVDSVEFALETTMGLTIVDGTISSI